MIQTATSRDGVTIRFETHGTDAPALVFVHGWSCDRSYWESQVPFFSPRYQVVTIDLGGHGESGTGRSTWTMPSFGEDVAAVVNRLGPGPAVLIGHSMGGDVIVEAAVRLPGRIAGLVWVDTYRSLGKGRSPEEVERFAAPFRSDFPSSTREFVRTMFPASADPGLVDRVVEDMASAPPEVALSALEHAISFKPEIVSSLPSLRLPFVAINPDDGGPTDVEGLERYGIETVLLPGVGHFLMMEDPDAFNRALAGVVERFAS